jgi:DedD protein
VKERLTGAIILVVLIVLLVPELLSGPSRSAPAPQAVTSSEEPPLRSYTINLADDSHTAGTSTGSSEMSPQASGPAQPTPITEQPTAAQQATDPDSAESGQSASAGSNPDTTRAGGSNPTQANANPTQGAPQTPSSPSTRNEFPQVQPRPAPTRAPPPSLQQQQRLAAADRATPDRPPSDWSKPDRPTADRVPAERAAADRAAPTPDKFSATGGWMVQLGVFSVQANAERLVQELKSQGFHALVSESGGGGRPLWRVRSGPVVERAAAEQLNARLRAAGHAGSVVPK